MTATIHGFSLRPITRSITRAIALATATTPAVVAAQATEEGEQQAGALEEVLVTATKREVNMQDVPMSIAAFNTEQMEKMGLLNMKDVLKVVPSMSTVTTVPGRNEVVFRGISTGSGEWRTDSGSAVYLGDIPMTSATQAVDPRMVDIHHVEALPGPQGTLFGSSSQSGAFRIIPNSPDHSGGYGSFSVSGTHMSEGDSGYSLEGWANVPLIEDTLTMRVALFDVETGGFIDNIYGTNIFTDDDNADVVEDNFNDWEQTGGRLSLLWTINDSWDIEGMYMNQTQTSNGDPKSDPNAAGVGDLEIVRFHKDVRDDDWWIGALTITGDLGFAEFKSVTSYLDREIFYAFDSTVDGQIRTQRAHEYYFGYSFYYNVLYDTAFHRETSINDQTAERFTQEFRLTSTSDSRLQWMVGAFYEKTDDWWDYDFANVEDLANTPFGYWWQLNYETYVPNTNAWYKEIYSSTTEQVAVFGELQYRITDRLSATVGARWFEYDRDRHETKEWPEGNAYETDIYKGTDDDTLFKFAIDYSVSDDKMVYVLFSEGFRLGGYNSIKTPSSVLPDVYDSDLLTNFEIGMKSQWLDNRLQANVNVYQMDWEDIQRGITDPEDWSANGTVNMGDAEIRGLEASLNYRVSENLRIDASYSWSDTELQDDYLLSDLVDGIDPPGDRGDPETWDWRDDQMGAKGQELAIAPPQKLWIGVEYSMPDLYRGLDGWIRYDHSWREEMYHDWWNAMHAKSEGTGRKLLGDVDEGSLQINIGKPGDWSLTVSIWNIWDDRNAQWIYSGYDGDFGPDSGFHPEIGRYVNMPGYNRPREFELTFRKDFDW
jgi:outer membrane receptor protein involved in Fe transport